MRSDIQITRVHVQRKKVEEIRNNLKIFLKPKNLNFEIGKKLR